MQKNKPKKYFFAPTRECIIRMPRRGNLVVLKSHRFWSFHTKELVLTKSDIHCYDLA